VEHGGSLSRRKLQKEVDISERICIGETESNKEERKLYRGWVGSE
jgi:hypothetical protein